MMRSMILSAVVFSAVLLAGCTTPWRQAQTNVDNSKNLRVGMTKQEVLKVMGEPARDEVFCKPDLWYYYIEPVWLDGLVSEDECMPLVFENGKLIGWGRIFYTAYRLRRNDNAKNLIPQKLENTKNSKSAAKAAPGK